MSVGFKDAITRALLTFSVCITLAAFCWILFDVLRFGVGEISWSYFSENPLSAGREGGIFSIIVSTLSITLVCMAVAIPIGLFSAMWLSEAHHNVSAPWRLRLVSLARYSLDALAGVPSIAFGLFGNAFFCVTLGLGFSILSGGLTLACMVLPIFTRQAEEALRAVPNEYRLAAKALGVSRGGTLFRVVLPSALPSIGAGFALGLGRALAETAALIFTSGYVDRTPESVFDSGRSLSIHIYDLAMNVPNGNARAYSAALVLVGLLLIINVCAALLSARFTPRQP